MIKYWVWALVMLLAACGGGGGDGGGSGVDPRLARIDIYEAQKLRVLGDPGAGVMGMIATPLAAIPDTGTALFTGSASIRVENPDAPLVLLGDSSISIAFDNGSASGTMDRFFGTDSSGAVVDYAGSIAVDGGSLDGGLSFDYAGALSAPGETLVFEGVMQGALLGVPVTALSAADLEASVIHNGTPIDATLIVIAETPGVVE